MPMLPNLDIGAAIKGIGGIIDEFKTTDEERSKAKAKLLEIENTLTSAIVGYESDLAKARRDIIVAETESSSWLTRNWRPILMLSITAILVHKYILYPYLTALFGDAVPELDLPDPLFTLLTVGVGGYVVGRSGEKIAQTIRSTEAENTSLVSEERSERRGLKLQGKQMRKLTKMAEKQGWSEDELSAKLRMLFE